MCSQNCCSMSSELCSSCRSPLVCYHIVTKKLNLIMDCPRLDNVFVAERWAWLISSWINSTMVSFNSSYRTSSICMLCNIPVITCLLSTVISNPFVLHAHTTYTLNMKSLHRLSRSAKCNSKEWNWRCMGRCISLWISAIHILRQSGTSASSKAEMEM